MSDNELVSDDDGGGGLNRSEDRDSNPGQPLNESISYRDNEVELDYEAEEDDREASKEVPEKKVKPKAFRYGLLPLNFQN